MEYVQLGKSTLRVSRLGFGCDPLGGHAWGRVDPAEVSRSVMLALDQGVTFFDTADCYGLGASEEHLGAVLAERRKEAIIATKFGVRIDGRGRTYFDNSREWADEALNASLKRLKTDYIDLYQVHYWDNKTPIEDLFDHLEKQRSEGKIRWYGVTNMNLWGSSFKAAMDGLISCSFEYSLANRVHEQSILHMTNNFGLGFLSWGSLGQGILSGKYDENTRFGIGDRRSRETYVNFHGEKLRQNLQLVQTMRKRLQRYPKMTLAQMAIRWILDYRSHDVVLVGIKNRQQLKENVRACQVRLNPEDVALLERMTR